MSSQKISRKLIIEALNDQHNTADFFCGNDYLDKYLKERSKKVIGQIGGNIYVLRHADTSNEVLGYYSLANYAINTNSLPKELRDQIPKWNPTSATLIGQFATLKELQGQGYGTFLLIKALRHCLELTEQMASAGVVVDPIDVRAEKFYLKRGFIVINDDPKRLFMHMKTLEQLKNSKD